MPQLCLRTTKVAFKTNDLFCMREWLARIHAGAAGGLPTHDLKNDCARTSALRSHGRLLISFRPPSAGHEVSNERSLGKNALDVLRASDEVRPRCQNIVEQEDHLRWHGRKVFMIDAQRVHKPFELRSSS